MRLIAFGDIHGQREKLACLLDQVRPTRTDHLVFLGDYIDRGPDSRGVVDLLIELAGDFPQTVFLRGNHEQMLLDAAKTEAPHGLPEWNRLIDLDPDWASSNGIYDLTNQWFMNGGRATLASYGVDEDERAKIYEGKVVPWNVVPQEHIDFLQATKLWHRFGEYLFIHAGVNDEPLEDQSPSTFLWSRWLPGGQEETHVVGHTPTKDRRPGFWDEEYRLIELDTGAGYGGPLTACDVLTRQFWQAL